MAEMENETPSQRQARLRRERRQAKIATGGADRLAAITGVQGRKAPEIEDISQPNTPSQRPATLQNTTSSSFDDPDHMDISAITPPVRPGSQLSGQNPFQLPNDHPAKNDPMVKMLEQMMGSLGSANSGPGGAPDAFADLATLLSGAGPGAGPGPGPGAGFGPGAPTAPTAPTVSAATWRVLHAVAALGLAVYVVSTSASAFTGSKVARETGMRSGGDGEALGARLFFWFATSQAVLQGSRFVLERGQAPEGGFVGTVVQFLPQPYAGWVQIARRYGVIAKSVMNDAFVVIFVLGVMAWWYGGIIRV